MAGKPRRRKAFPSPLQFEVLERRELFYVGAIVAHVLADDGGTPGAVIADNTVHAGDSFFLEVTALDADPVKQGFQGVAIDLHWSPGVITETDSAPFDPKSVVTPALPLFSTGTLDNQNGALWNLGGSSFTALGVGHPIGHGAPERFALLHFQAVAEGTTSLSLDQGVSRIVTQPTAALSNKQLYFEAPTITVLAAEAAPALSTLAPTLTTANTTTELTSPPANSSPPTAATAGTVIVSAGLFVNQLGPFAPPTATPAVVPSSQTTVSEQSLDANGDGVFSFADFGLLNVSLGLAHDSGAAAASTAISNPVAATPAAVVAPPAAVPASLSPQTIAFVVTASGPAAPPHDVRAAATDAVFAAPPTASPAASSVLADDGLLAALASALAASRPSADLAPASRRS